jgi:hypothetical protein
VTSRTSKCPDHHLRIWQEEYAALTMHLRSAQTCKVTAAHCCCCCFGAAATFGMGAAAQAQEKKEYQEGWPKAAHFACVQLLPVTEWVERIASRSPSVPPADNSAFVGNAPTQERLVATASQAQETILLARSRSALPLGNFLQPSPVA